MRHFVYFSQNAATSGKALSGDLMKAGRMDIAIHVLISSFFLSHAFRKDVKLHLIFYGMPDPPKHIEIQVTEELGLNKKDVGKIIQKILYKYKEDEKKEIFPGCFIEKKSFLNIIEDLINDGKKIFVLDKGGEDLRDVEIPDDSVFVLGDHEGLPKKEYRRLRKNEAVKEISIGPKVYFASQVVAIVNNELDRRGI
jgi:tRNA (pseudouridine54-N1)-methyltransferase